MSVTRLAIREAEPAVRTDSLVEQRGFELPVLFVVPGAYERLEVSAGSLRKAARRIILRFDLLANSGGKRLDFGPFSNGEKAKEDRRFESPLLHQRGTANQFPAPKGSGRRRSRDDTRGRWKPGSGAEHRYFSLSRGLSVAMHSDFKTACLISANSWGVVPLAGPRLSKRVRPFLHSSDEAYDS